MQQIDINKIIEIIRYVSKTEVMPLFKNLKTSDIREKSPDDFVTIADENSEAAFTKLLKEAVADSLVVGEEAVAKDETILNLLDKKSTIWLIDPIDGTYNYKTGNENFGILITMLKNGKTEIGFCYDAPKDECYYAIKGKGVFNDKHQKISLNKENDKKKISNMHGLVGHSQLVKLKGHFGKLSRIRCSLHITLKFMKGEADFVLWNTITPWDNAGCSLLVAELGCYIAYVDGREFIPTQKPHQSLLLGAKNKQQWQEIADAINLANQHIC